MTEETELSKDKILCECGCGEYIPRINTSGNPGRFKRGHNCSGILHWNWNGGVTYYKGYRMISMKNHPRANKRGYVGEHVLVLEQKICRYLNPGEEPHHINEIKTDNRPENLQLVTHVGHVILHHRKDMSNRVCVDCGGNSTWKRQWHSAGEGLWRCSHCGLRHKRAIDRGISC